MNTLTQHHQPFGILDAIIVRLWIAKRAHVDGICLFNFGSGAVADENRLSSPLDNNLNQIVRL